MSRLLVIALLVAACGGSGGSPVTSTAPSAGGGTILGTFTLTDPAVFYSQGTTCHGTGGFSDIDEGLGVTVKDQTGTIIGSTALALNADKSSPGLCRYTWSVPVGLAKFYTVTVGKRGDLTYSYADIVSRAWKVDATLGD